MADHKEKQKYENYCIGQRINDLIKAGSFVFFAGARIRQAGEAFGYLRVYLEKPCEWTTIREEQKTYIVDDQGKAIDAT